MLDIGCGNGRNMIKEAIGCDNSLNLLKLGKGSIRCNAVNLPFKDNSFEIVISVAVIHHLSSKERRNKAIQEFKRVMKEYGLIYVWNFEYIKNDYKKINDERKDVIATWRGKHSRYVHFFEKQEFLELLKSVDFEIIEFGEEAQSLYAYVKK